MKLSAILALCPSLCLAQTAAETYASAQEALKRQDCKAAVVFLESYKTASAERLKQQQQFRDSIDRQIAECKRFVGTRGDVSGSFSGNAAGPSPATRTPDISGLELR